MLCPDERRLWGGIEGRHQKGTHAQVQSAEEHARGYIRWRVSHEEG